MISFHCFKKQDRLEDYVVDNTTVELEPKEVSKISQTRNVRQEFITGGYKSRHTCTM